MTELVFCVVVLAAGFTAWLIGRVAEETGLADLLNRLAAIFLQCLAWFSSRLAICVAGTVVGFWILGVAGVDYETTWAWIFLATGIGVLAIYDVRLLVKRFCN